MNERMNAKCQELSVPLEVAKLHLEQETEEESQHQRKQNLSKPRDKEPRSC